MEIWIASRMRQIHIARKRMKNIVLRVDEEGNLKISCPNRTPLSEIERFIREKENWIARTEAAQEKKEEKNACGTDRKTCMWLGRQMRVRIEKAGRSRLVFEGDTAVFFLRQDTDDEIRRVFYRAAGRQLQLIAAELRREWDQKICDAHLLPHPVIRLKYMTSRWGSCTPARNSISLSLRLIHHPVQCTEYVILHEYAHLLVPNHSKAFYDIIRMHMPDWKTYSDLLR